MNRYSRGGAVVEMVLVVPILLLILGGAFRLLAGAWSDVWRARRYSDPAMPAAVATELAALPVWSTPPDRLSAQLRLRQKTWMKNGNSIWNEIEVDRDEK